MRKALHPTKNVKIEVPEYIRAFGNDTPEFHERPRCPVCEQRLAVVASSTTDSIGHFAHMRGSGFCPTKSSAASPYNGLPPRNPDPAAALRLKAAFVQNWRQHFSRLDWLVKGLAIDEFTDIIRLANRERIWEYAQLQEGQLPYVFATLTDFPQSRSYQIKGVPTRKCWFRCWFDASVQRYDDLWIHRDTPLLFWRAWYALRAGKRKPGSEDLIDGYSEELSYDFLNQPVQLPSRVENSVAQWLTKNF